MSTLLKYKSYLAQYRLEVDEGVFVGRVINANDVISFEAETAKGLVSAFHKAIDDYLSYCAEQKIVPEKPFNGNFVIRTDADLHRELFEMAAASEKSMNDFAVEGLRRFVNEKKAVK